MIVAEALQVNAGSRVLLSNVSLALHPGEVMAVVGPNGAGKSTLLRALAGEIPARAGRVTFEGRALAAWHPRDLARRRAVVPQHTAPAFPMTARQLVSLGRLPWHGTPAVARDAEAVASGLDAAGIAHLADRWHATLSGGEKQRVAIGRALAQLDGAAPPAALLLDEPTASLDAAHGASLLGLLRLLAARGLAVLVVLHELNEALFVADRVALLESGRLIALGAPDAVLDPAILQDVYGIAFRKLEGGGLLPAYGRDVLPSAQPARAPVALTTGIQISRSRA